MHGDSACPPLLSSRGALQPTSTTSARPAGPRKAVARPAGDTGAGRGRLHHAHRRLGAPGGTPVLGQQTRDPGGRRPTRTGGDRPTRRGVLRQQRPLLGRRHSRGQPAASPSSTSSVPRRTRSSSPRPTVAVPGSRSRWRSPPPSSSTGSRVRTCGTAWPSAPPAPGRPPAPCSPPRTAVPAGRRPRRRRGPSSSPASTASMQSTAPPSPTTAPPSGRPSRRTSAAPGKGGRPPAVVEDPGELSCALDGACLVTGFTPTTAGHGQGAIAIEQRRRVRRGPPPRCPPAPGSCRVRRVPRDAPAWPGERHRRR